MKDVNKMILLGRLGANPIQRQTKAGISVVQFSVATSRRILKEIPIDGQPPQYTDETQWHKVVAWGKQGESCALYLKKGNRVYVEGHLRTRQYNDEKGNTRTSVELHADQVSFLESRSTTLSETFVETTA